MHLTNHFEGKKEDDTNDNNTKQQTNDDNGDDDDREKKSLNRKRKQRMKKKHNGKKHWKRVCEVFGMILLIKWPCSSSLSPFLFLSVPYGMNSVSFLAWHLHDFLLPFTPYSLM